MTIRRSPGVRTWIRSGLGASPVAAVGLVMVFALAGPAAASWGVGLVSGSRALSAASGAPAAPPGLTSTCTSANATTVKLSWSAVGQATSYSVFDSTTGVAGTYLAVAAGIPTTGYTTGALAVGTHFFEVEAVSGANWPGAKSAPAAGRLIGLGTCG